MRKRLRKKKEKKPKLPAPSYSDGPEMIGVPAEYLGADPT